MRVAIFENEYIEVETAFKAVNLLYFDNALIFENFASSQSFGSLDRVKTYDLILVDLDLSIKSLLDGYALIKEIINIDNSSKIIILTGAFEDEVNTKLHDKGLPRLPIIKKPVDIDDIYAKIKQVANT